MGEHHHAPEGVLLHGVLRQWQDDGGEASAALALATAGAAAAEPGVSAIIFDCDGTLVDTETSYMEAFNKALAATHAGPGAPPVVLPDRWGRELCGKGLEADAEYAVAKFNLGNTTAAVFLELWKKFFAELVATPRSIPLLDGFDELFTYAKAQGLRLAVASSSDGPGLLMKLRNGVVANSEAVTDLASAFDAVVSNDDVTRHKPDPEIYELAAKRLGVAPRDCLVVEDTATGVLAGRRAGMRVLAVPNQYTRGNNDFSQADVVLGSLRDVIPVLQRAARGEAGAEARAGARAEVAA